MIPYIPYLSPRARSLAILIEVALYPCVTTWFVGLTSLIVLACDSKETVVTERGNFTVPGFAKVSGGSSIVTAARMENGCEITSPGQRVEIVTSKKVMEGGRERTLFEIKGMRGCSKGWIDAAYLSPEAKEQATE